MSQEETNQDIIGDAIKAIKEKRSMLKMQAPASCARRTLPEMINDMKVRLAESRKLEALFKHTENNKPNQ